MSGKWTAEEVRELLLKIAGGPISVTQRVELFDIASNYAERIKADEGVVPAWQTFFDKYAIGGLTAPSCFGCGMAWASWDGCTRHAELPSIFLCSRCAEKCKGITHPPAQAAHANDAITDYYTGRNRGGWAAPRNKTAREEAAEPAAQGEACDSALTAYRDAWNATGTPWRSLTAAEYLAHQHAVLALAAQPRAVPDGWALVPREPTKEMIEQGASSLQVDVDFTRRPQLPTRQRAARNAYVSMLITAAKQADR